MSRLSVLRSLYGYGWRHHRRWVAAHLALLSADICATALFGLALRQLIQSAHRGAHGAAFAVAAVAGLSWAASAVGSWARTNLVYLLAEAGSVDMDTRILGMIGQLETVEHLESTEYADRVALLRRGGDLLGHYAWGALDVAAGFLRLTAVLVLLVLVSPVFLLPALPLVLVLWTQRRGQRVVGRSIMATAEDGRLAEHLYTVLTEPAAGMEIRVAGAGEALRERLQDVSSRVNATQERARWRAVGLSTVGWALFVAGYAAVLLSVVDGVAAGRSTPGEVLMAITLTLTLRAQAESVVAALSRSAEGIHFLDAYLWLRERSGSSTGRKVSAAVPARLRHGIDLHGVSFRYPGATVPALSDIDLHIPAGSTLAVVGAHGAGKTTLVKLLCRLHEPSSGTITVDGVPLDASYTAAWRTRTTATFQDHVRFAFPIRESVGVGELSALGDDAHIARALKHGDADGIVRDLPEGLDTQLGRDLDGHELSGGQWQRISLSRAFMRERPLLFVLDEPTASLDARSEYAVYQRQMEFARRFARRTGAVTVMISHRFSTVRMADRILVLSDGRITESGSHDELLALEGTYAELYRLQAHGYQSGPGPEPASVT